jgi:hypothetical protein
VVNFGKTHRQCVVILVVIYSSEIYVCVEQYGI